MGNILFVIVNLCNQLAWSQEGSANKSEVENLRNEVRQSVAKKEPPAQRLRKLSKLHMANPDNSGGLDTCGKVNNKSEKAMYHFKRGCVVYALYQPRDNSSIRGLTPTQIEEGLDIALQEFNTALKEDIKFAEAYRQIAEIMLDKSGMYMTQPQPAKNREDMRKEGELRKKGGRTHPSYSAKSENFIKLGLDSAIKSLETDNSSQAFDLLMYLSDQASRWHTALPKSLLSRARNVADLDVDEKRRQNIAQILDKLDKFAE